MTEKDLPPVPNLSLDDIEVLLQHMEPEDVRRYNEYCMIYLPGWLFRAIRHEAQLSDMPFEDFIRQSCLNEIRSRFQKRSEERINENSKKSSSK